jgi:hypothetical protein
VEDVDSDKEQSIKSGGRGRGRATSDVSDLIDDEEEGSDDESYDGNEDDEDDSKPPNQGELEEELKGLSANSKKIKVPATRASLRG